MGGVKINGLVLSFTEDEFLKASLTYPVPEQDVALRDDVLLGGDGLQLLPVGLREGHPKGRQPEDGHQHAQLGGQTVSQSAQ